MKGILNKALVLISLIASAPLLASSSTSDALKTAQSHAYDMADKIKTGTVSLIESAKETINQARKNNYLTSLGQSLSKEAASKWQLAAHNPEMTAAIAILGAAAIYIGYMDYQTYHKQQKNLKEHMALEAYNAASDPYHDLYFNF